jgi:hypothetical protein
MYLVDTAVYFSVGKRTAVGRVAVDDPVLELLLESRRASQFRYVRFSKITHYLRDNAIWINVICFEACGQQEHRHSPTHGALAELQRAAR